jgi:chitinase
MDPQTDAQLFWDVAEAKIYNPDLEVFLSIGGWTFSDNNTATQPVFGNIASTETNRQTFANNLVKFLKHYGYNGTLFSKPSVQQNTNTNLGIDIDWEYPGAPDRGGHPDDVQNFVSMMKTIRQTFDASGSKYGLTYTAPTSYWYLRWFDLKGLSKYTGG